MEQSNDLWDDMATLNSLYGELCWNHEDPLEFHTPIMKTIELLLNEESMS